MIRMQKEDGVLIVDHTPWSYRILFAVFIVIGLVLLYHFSLAGRLECRRAPEGGTCTLYRSSVFQTETQTFPLQELKEALTVMVGSKGATRVDLILKDSVVEFSHRNSDSTRAKHVAAKINEFIETDEKKKLDVQQKPDVFSLFIGLFLSGVGLITLLFVGASTRMRFDSTSDKLSIWRGFPVRKLHEFKVSELDHLDVRRDSLLLVFQDGTFYKFDVFSQSEVSSLQAEIDRFMEQHIPKERSGDWA